MLCASDLVQETPLTRWRSDALADNSVSKRMGHGGFIARPEAFANALFGVSPAEAAAMDPQQRLLLELGYAALHAGGPCMSSSV